MNTALLLPVNGVPIVPFAALGAGAIFSMEGNPVASIMVLNASDTTTEAGLSDLFNDGALVLGTLNLQLSLNDQMGIQTFSVGYSTRTFTFLNKDPRVVLPNVPLNPQSGGWIAWWSGTQYIEQFDPKNNPMHGWGLLGRFGMSEDEVAPLTYWANAGLGGNSRIHGRQNDRWGVGWFYGSSSNELGSVVSADLNVDSHTTGVEMLYNITITENFFVTPDLQVIKPGRNKTNTVVVAGVRGEIRI
jgi:porin